MAEACDVAGEPSLAGMCVTAGGNADMIQFDTQWTHHSTLSQLEINCSAYINYQHDIFQMWNSKIVFGNLPVLLCKLLQTKYFNIALWCQVFTFLIVCNMYNTHFEAKQNFLCNNSTISQPITLKLCTLHLLT